MLGYLAWAVACLSTFYLKTEYIPDSPRTVYCKGILGCCLLVYLDMKTASIPQLMVFRAVTW